MIEEQKITPAEKIITGYAEFSSDYKKIMANLQELLFKDTRNISEEYIRKVYDYMNSTLEEIKTANSTDKLSRIAARVVEKEDKISLIPTSNNVRDDFLELVQKSLKKRSEEIGIVIEQMGDWEH